MTSTVAVIAALIVMVGGVGILAFMSANQSGRFRRRDRVRGKRPKPQNSRSTKKPNTADARKSKRNAA